MNAPINNAVKNPVIDASLTPTPNKAVVTIYAPAAGIAATT